MQIREHKGNYKAAMRTVVKIEPARDAVVKWAKERLAVWTTATLDFDELIIEKYGDGPDVRNGWDTHIVHFPGLVLGFTDGPVKS